MDFSKIKFGYRPDPSHIEYNPFSKDMFKSAAPLYSNSNVDLRPFSVKRHDQGQTSTCVCNAVPKALEIKRVQKHGVNAHVDLSVAALYFDMRDRMVPKETNVDQGGFIYLACEVLKTSGVCRASTVPFTTENLFTPVPILGIREQYMNKITQAYKIQSTGQDRVDDVIANLQMGNPVVFASNIGNNWRNYNSKSSPLLPPKLDDIIGGHATCLVGYVDGVFIDENSWSEEWGKDGFAELEPEVISSSLSTDFWVIEEGSEVWVEK